MWFKKKQLFFKPVKGRVSIVTVTYNAEEFLEKTIQSIITQSYPNIEYIIIDGGSTDKTLEIIKKYQDDIAYWVSEVDDGIYDAMNKGIEKATGEWINFMNSGDGFVNTNIIERVLNKIPKDTDLVYGNTRFVNGSGKELYIQKGKNIKDFLWKGIGFNHNSLFCKTALMKEHPFNTFYKIVADSEFLIWAQRQEKNFYCLDMLINYFMTGGISHEQAALRLVERWKLVSDYKMNDQKSIDLHYFRRILDETNLLAWAGK
jgi:glycosyltransferase involved in cell wall biosynthesis